MPFDDPEKQKRYEQWLKTQQPVPEDQYGPIADMGSGEKFLAGIGQGMTNVARQVGNMAGVVSDEELEEAKRLDEALLDTGWGSGGSFVGETAALLPAGGVAGGAVRSVVSRAAPRVAPVAGYGAEGAVEGAILAGPEDRLTGAGMGAAIGTGVGTVGDKIVHGMTRTPAAQTLLNEGVDLTPGQMNPGGVMSVLEESAAARLMPNVAAARESAQLGQFNAMINRSLPPGGRQIELGDSDQMVKELKDQFSKNYDSFKNYPVDASGLETSLINRVQNSPVEDSVIDAEIRNIKDKMGVYGNARTFGELQKYRSEVRDDIRTARRSGSVQDARTATMLERVEDELTTRMEASLPPSKIDLLRNTDRKYRDYVVVEGISFRSGDRPQPTPFQMSQAVKQARDTKSQYATGGGGPLRDITKAGREAFSINTPPTGMSTFVPAALAAIGATAGSGLGPAGMVAGLALPAAVPGVLSGTRAGRNMMSGQSIAQGGLQDIADHAEALNVPLPEFLRAIGVNIGVGED